MLMHMQGSDINKPFFKTTGNPIISYSLATLFTNVHIRAWEISDLQDNDKLFNAWLFAIEGC